MSKLYYLDEIGSTLFEYCLDLADERLPTRVFVSPNDEVAGDETEARAVGDIGKSRLPTETVVAERCRTKQRRSCIAFEHHSESAFRPRPRFAPDRRARAE